MLCLRGFNSAESLIKHQNISKLHKVNLFFFFLNTNNNFILKLIILIIVKI